MRRENRNGFSFRASRASSYASTLILYICTPELRENTFFSFTPLKITGGDFFHGSPRKLKQLGSLLQTIEKEYKNVIILAPFVSYSKHEKNGKMTRRCQEKEKIKTLRSKTLSGSQWALSKAPGGQVSRCDLPVFPDLPFEKQAWMWFKRWWFWNIHELIMWLWKSHLTSQSLIYKVSAMGPQPALKLDESLPPFAVCPLGTAIHPGGTMAGRSHALKHTHLGAALTAIIWLLTLSIFSTQ